MAKIAIAQKRASTPGKLSESQRKEIEKLAYQFFIERGGQDGNDQADWLRAEAIVRSRRN